MKNQVLNFYREYKRIIGLFAFIVLSVCLFYGIYSLAPRISNSAEHYLATYHLEDIKISSAVGLDETEFSIVESLEGVKEILTGHQTDVTVKETGSSLSIESYTPSDGNIQLIEGRFPEKAGEIAIDQHILRFPYGITDRITIVENHEAHLEGMDIKNFEIVGIVRSPGFLLPSEKGHSPITGAKLDGFALVVPEAFIESDPNVARIYLNTATTSSVLADEYRALVEEKTAQLKRAFEPLPPIKAQVMIEKAKDRVEKATTEIQEIEKQLKETEQTLDQQNLDLKKEEKRYEEKKTAFEAQLKKSTETISSGKSKIEELEAQMAETELALEKTSQSINEQRPLDDQLVAALEQQRTSVEDLEYTIQSSQKSINQDRSNAQSAIQKVDRQVRQFGLKKSGLELQHALFPSKRPQLDREIADVNASLSRLASEKTYYESILDEVSSRQDALDFEEDRLDNAYAELSSLEGERQASLRILEGLNKDLENGQKELEKTSDALSKQTLEYAEALEFVEKKQESFEKEVEDLKASIEEKKKNYNELVDSWDETRKDATEKVEANQKIINAGNMTLSGEHLPTYNISNMTSNRGMVQYYNMLKRIEMMTRFYPIAIFLLSMFFVSTYVSSILRDERKLLLPWTVSSERMRLLKKHAMRFFVSGLIAWCIGLLFGHFMLSNLLIERFLAPFIVPSESGTLHWMIALVAFLLLMIAFMIPLFLIYRIKDHPIKPRHTDDQDYFFPRKAPKAWEKRTDIQKNTLRNFFEMKTQNIVFIAGIAMVTLLLFGGIGLFGAIDGVTTKQFEEVILYDASMRLEPSTTESEQNDLMYFLTDIKGARTIEKGLTEDAMTAIEGKPAIGFTITVLENPDLLPSLIHLINVDNSDNVSTGGAILTEKMANRYQLAVGDELSFTEDSVSVRKVKISAIVKNYVDHVLYLTPDVYIETLEHEPLYNTLFVNLLDKSHFAMDNFEEESVKYSAVQSVETVAKKERIVSQFIDPLLLLSLIYIIVAVWLELLILSYLTGVYTHFRIRKVLSLSKKDEKPIDYIKEIYAQNLLIIFVGAMIGLLFGIFFFKILVRDTVPDAIMLVPTLRPISFIATILTIMLVSWIVITIYHATLQAKGRIDDSIQ